MSIKATDQLPNLPETEVIQPILQCGVLYLGTALPTPGRHGLDAVQEPLSHRYPIDGINTVRGIDSILSIYDNGIQLVFARQTHVALFYPWASLIYCACVRYAIVENEQTSSLDWRFVPIDAATPKNSKHPPLFCAVMQRTQIQSGDECHCFITKNDDAALALVRTVSEAYGNLSPDAKLFKSPIFYHLDRYGRRISETTGTIYLSPAKEIDALCTILDRNDLLDPAYDGFFYRTDLTAIEQWQLWDDHEQSDANRIQSRPRPPPSPFGLHQGLYHDDLSSDIYRHLDQMEDEEATSDSDSTISSVSSSSSSSTLDEYRQFHPRDLRNASFVRSTTSAFDPSSLQPKPPPPIVPIVIEKVVRKPPPVPREVTPVRTIPLDEHRDKTSPDRNRIVYTDVIQTRPRRQPPRIPVIDVESLSSQSSINAEILDGFFEDFRGKATDLTGSDAESLLKKLHSTSDRQHRDEHQHRRRRRRRSSTLIRGQSAHYGQRPVPNVSNPESITRYVSNNLSRTAQPMMPFPPLLLREYRQK